MKKLVQGIVEFRRNALPGYREMFARLALGQSPDTLFFACSDSRVVPNLFASTDPGDLFVVRNVGNLIPSCQRDGHSTADESEAAAIEFALMNLNITNIVVCGHSECGAMHAILEGRARVPAPNLRAWLRHAEPSLKRSGTTAPELSAVNRLSQLNVLQQIDHLRTYPIVQQRLTEGKLQLHGWWFELENASVHAYDESTAAFVLLDEARAERILAAIAKAE